MYCGNSRRQPYQEDYDMIQEIMHVGVTVRDLDRSIAFYRDVLGLTFQGEILMEGPETDALFRRTGCRARVAYLNGSDHVMAPPLELIQFVDKDSRQDPADLFKTSISEICFRVRDLDAVYESLVAHGVDCLSAPQPFDFTASGFGKSKALYFRDPDGIIMELMESVS